MKTDGYYVDGEFLIIEMKDGKITRMRDKETGQEYAQIAETASEPVPPRLRGGGYAIFTEDENEHYAGEIVRIVNYDPYTLGTLNYQVEDIFGNHRGWASERVLTPVAKSEIIPDL